MTTTAPPVTRTRHYHFAFAVEYAIGHITFANTVREAVEADPSIDADWHLMSSLPESGWQKRYLSERNYTLQMGLRVRLAVEGERKALDALLIHTQTAALLSWGLMGKLPTIISTDATPRNIDELSAAYLHRQGSPLEEDIKRRIMGSLFRRARYVVPSSQWAANSLVHTYGVPEQQVKVIKSGIHLSRWPLASERRPGPPRLLFVGGDFKRKGGEVLLDALREIAGPWHLDAVTRSALPSDERVTVHNDLHPSDPQLLDLYQQADAFVFPSLGDAVPWVILEAMASGTPVISTAVGAIPEMVPRNTGIIVPPKDARALRSALESLLHDPTRREGMGAAGRALIERDHDAGKTSRSMLDLMKSVAG